MEISEARLDNIESQNLTDASHSQKRQSYFSMKKINNFFHTFCSRVFLRNRGEAMPENTESTLEFLDNLKWSDLFDVPGEYKLMDAEILSNLNDGNEEWVEKLRSHETPLACLQNNRGDSVLHLAAMWNNLELVKNIISKCPCLLLQPNYKDQLPIHVAARDGHLAVVKVLIASITFFSSKLGEEDREMLDPYILKDINGDTALNLALKGRCMQVALCLVNANRHASFLASKDGISALYLAIEIGSVYLVKEMLGNDDPEGINFNLEGRRYIIHGALKSMNIEVVDIVLNKFPSLVDERDEKGRTCIMFGASIGYHEGVCKLLDLSTKEVFLCDNDGSYPIHVATEKGHVDVVKEILKRCPYSKHLLNKKNQNILHIAAKLGRLKIIYFQACRNRFLASEQDVDGNTPLHLATIHWRFRAVEWLTNKKNLWIRNNDDLTALDIAESNFKSKYIFRERATLMVLCIDHTLNDPTCKQTMKLTRPVVHEGSGNKEYVNALLVVAALIATVTFTAAFTLPGGTKESAPNLGMSNLINDSNLLFFLIYDVVALESSLFAIISLIMAQLGDAALYVRYITWAMISLIVAVFFMNLAFSMVIAIVAGYLRWFIIIVTFFISPALCFLVRVFVPHLVLHGYGTRFRLIRALVFLLSTFDEDGMENNQVSTQKTGKNSKNDDKGETSNTYS